MSGLFAICSSGALPELDWRGIDESINLADTLRNSNRSTSNYYLSTSHRANQPISGDRIFDNDRWIFGFSGDLINRSTIPFTEIEAALESQEFDLFAQLEGIFCLVALDKIRSIVYVITDRRGQKPIFYQQLPNTITLSTHLATFTRLQDAAQFDEHWLWQNMFFNFTIDSTTFLKNVKRLPAASVLSYELNTGHVRERAYAEMFQTKAPLLRGTEALEYATEVFADRIPAHYQGADRYACALTGGWDGRTMLALAPDDAQLTAYTYGCANSNDLCGGAKTARLAGIEHIPIEFDNSFVDNLPELALNTVRLSSGMQGILRSTLLYAYDKLTQGGGRFPVTISGISLDMQFRGHAHRPNLISDELALLFEGRNFEYQEDYWKSIYGDVANDFHGDISEKLAFLEDRFGPFSKAEHHLSYAVYPLSTSNFSGELMISDLFTTVRVPAWDSKIVALAYAIENSTLSFSQFLPNHERGSRKELILQAYLMKKLSPYFYTIPVSGRSPASVLAGELPYWASRFRHAVSKRIRSRSMRNTDGPLEDWDTWLFDRNPEFLNDLLRASDCRVSDYVQRAYIDQMLATRDLRFIGKLATTEIILRLIENRWEKFW